ncbi:hypothetical protein Ec53638_A0217 (plasmid) [Escherichia coli 53638]|nr:hypothetical protein Ec53638_A0217 [Escherichia coli 53638]
MILRCSAHGRPARGVAGSGGNRGLMIRAFSARSADNSSLSDL